MAQRPATDSGKKADFEKSLARLEEIVRRLENASLTLDDGSGEIGRKPGGIWR